MTAVLDVIQIGLGILVMLLGMVFLLLGIKVRNEGAGGDVKEATYLVSMATAMFALMAALGFWWNNL